MNRKITGTDKNDIINGTPYNDIISGGLGSDSIYLNEIIKNSDIVHYNPGDSNILNFDKIFSFDKNSDYIHKDRLDLPTNYILKNGNYNGIDIDNIKSHHIFKGVISFYPNDNTLGNSIVVNNNNFISIEKYLENNIINGSTVSFGFNSDTFIFQDGGACSNDTFIELIGINNGGLSSTGDYDVTNPIWII